MKHKLFLESPSIFPNINKTFNVSRILTFSVSAVLSHLAFLTDVFRDFCQIWHFWFYSFLATKSHLSGGRYFWERQPFDTHSTANLLPLAILNEAQAFFGKPIFFSKKIPKFLTFWVFSLFQSRQSCHTWHFWIFFWEFCQIWHLWFYSFLALLAFVLFCLS